MRLLWVENHAQFVRTAGRQFLAEHAVTVVTSIAAARQALAEQPFDAVLLDYDLDDGKGSELLSTIDRLANRPAVIATSSHDPGNDALMRAGANAVCGKIRFSEIGAVLARIIAGLAPGEPASKTRHARAIEVQDG